MCVCVCVCGCSSTKVMATKCELPLLNGKILYQK